MELDSDDELTQEIQSVLAATDPYVTTSAVAPSSPKLTSTSSGLSSSPSGVDMEGPGPAPTSRPLPQRQGRLAPAARAVDFLLLGPPSEGPQRPPRQRAAATM